jgi:hypothetical protein
MEEGAKVKVEGEEEVRGMVSGWIMRLLIWKPLLGMMKI